MKLWVGSGSAVAATSTIHSMVHSTEKCLISWAPSCSSVQGKKWGCISAVWGQTPWKSCLQHSSPRVSDKGWNLPERSCWDLGFLHWQPVDFSDLSNWWRSGRTLGRETTSFRATQRIGSCVWDFWAGFALPEVWLCMKWQETSLLTGTVRMWDKATCLGVVPARISRDMATHWWKGRRCSHSVCKGRSCLV